jgi:hypothetical protein
VKRDDATAAADEAARAADEDLHFGFAAMALVPSIERD